jgi:ATPase subunit of ABC transporter with duplicated ATPase domains
MIALVLKALAFAKRLPWQVYAAIGAALLLWFTYHRGYDAARTRYRAEMAQMAADYRKAQDDAQRAAQAALDAENARYRALASQSETRHAQDLAAADAATSDFIRRNRVRSCPAASATGGTVAAPDSGSASVAEGVSSGVVMADSDVRTCAALYAYSVEAHRWAMTLGQ